MPLINSRNKKPGLTTETLAFQGEDGGERLINFLCLIVFDDEY
jgi:hypothetical protein